MNPQLQLQIALLAGNRPAQQDSVRATRCPALIEARNGLDSVTDDLLH
jgi:hypothetical protein